nr:adenylate/guanylate cyclase domain-containing protein [Oscillatoria sp. FACHB-1406]
MRLQQNNAETTVPSNRTEFIIGRLPECDWCLPFGEISRRHVRLFKNASGEWLVEDLGSKNGSRLNDRRLLAPVALRRGDLLELGDVGIEVGFLVSRPQPSTVPPKPTTFFHNVRELQQRWMLGQSQGDRAFQDKDEAIARLQDLVEISKQLSVATSLDEIFARVQEVVFRYLTHIDRLALLIQQEDSNELKLLQAAARDASEQSTLILNSSWVSHTICQTVFDERVAVQIADAQADERFSSQHSVLFNNICTCIAVPLWNENRALGVLYADANHSSRDWAEAGERDLSFFSALANLIAANVQRSLLLQKLKNEEMLRQRLERYHSPGLVQQLLAVNARPLDTVTHDGDGRLPPIESDISILFADVVGFTALSERLTPVQVAQLLNRLFEEMTAEIFALGGTLDKYIGDCIMAFFGAPEAQPDCADRSVTVALRMLARLAGLNATETFGEPLQLRIAINTGRAVVGDVGSSQRLEYTALGGTINLASRMESICPPGECVVSEATYNRLSARDSFQEMGEYRFKGIERPIKIYRSALTIT